jgi:hypothetical protein
MGFDERKLFEELEGILNNLLLTDNPRHVTDLCSFMMTTVLTLKPKQERSGCIPMFAVCGAKLEERYKLEWKFYPGGIVWQYTVHDNEGDYYHHLNGNMFQGVKSYKLTEETKVLKEISIK